MLPHAPHTTKQRAAHAEALQTKRKKVGSNDLKCERILLYLGRARSSHKSALRGTIGNLAEQRSQEGINYHCHDGIENE